MDKYIGFDVDDKKKTGRILDGRSWNQKPQLQELRSNFFARKGLKLLENR